MLYFYRLSVIRESTFKPLCKSNRYVDIRGFSTCMRHLHSVAEEIISQKSSEPDPRKGIWKPSKDTPLSSEKTRNSSFFPDVLVAVCILAIAGCNEQ